MSYQERIKEWVSAEEPPSEPGWYARIKCWDANEGFFPGADYWDGRQWIGNPPLLHRSPHPFPTKAEAEVWADARDIEIDWEMPV